MATPNVARSASAPRADGQGSLTSWLAAGVYGLLAAVFALASPARAGDDAQPAIIGYSMDLRYFAFEEFGYEDPSGFPYSNIYVFDLEDNSFVKGTPVRVRLDPQAGPQAALLVRARALARQNAKSWIESLDITWPAQILAYNGDGVID